MPRTTIAPSAGVGIYPVLPVTADAADLAFAAADVTNKNQIAFGTAANLLLLCWNTNAASTARTATITSALDTLNRSGDITAYSVGAGEIAYFVIPRNGFRQSDGYLYLEGSNAEMKFAAIQL